MSSREMASGVTRTRCHSSALFEESKLSKAVAELLVQRLPGFL